MTHRNSLVRTLNIAAPLVSLLAPALAARWLERLFTTPMKWRTPDRERAWLSSATRSQVRFDAQRELAVYAWGNGPTILLVHGWSGRGSQMGVYAAPLVARGFRVISFDGPAHGRSEGKTSALPEFALAVERVAEAMGPIFAIISHSLGTAATTMAVARGVSAERLVYISPPEDLPKYLARLAGFLGFSPHIPTLAQKRLERRYGVPFEEARGTALAPDLEVPLLIVHDEQDGEVPHPEGRRLAECWPGSRLITTRGLGHHRIVRDPDVVRSVVSFVADGAEASAHTMKRGAA